MSPLSRLSCASALAFSVFGLTIAHLMWPAGGMLDVSGHAIGRDFVNVWNGSRLALSGQVATLFDLEAYRGTLEAAFGAGFKPHNWSYPPHALILFAPFGALSYPWALALWTAATMAAFLGAVAMALPPERRLTGLLVAALSPASVLDVAFGQNGHLTAAFLLAGVACIDRRPWLAGVFFGLLTIKPHLGILIPFALIAIGAWRPIVSAALTAGVLVAASAALYGIDAWRLYFKVTTGVQGDILAHTKGMLLVMMPTVYQAAKVAFGADAAAPLQAIASAAAFVAGVVFFRRARDTATRALVLSSATLLVLPYAFNYDMVALAGATVWLAARPLRPSVLSALTVAWIAPPLMIFLGLYDIPIGPFALAAALAASWEGRPQQRPEPAPVAAPA